MQSVRTPSSWHDYFPAFSAIFACDASLSLGNVKAYYTLWPDVKRKTMWFSLFGRVFICLVACLFVCLFFSLRLFSFLCFLMIDDTYALAIYTSRGASLKQKQCGFLCLFVCLFVWSLVCLCVLLFPLFVFLVSLFYDDR